MNPTLICVIIVIVVFGIVGLKQGILKMLLPLVFALAAVIVMVFLTPEITRAVSAATDWDEQIHTATEEYFEEKGLLLDDESIGEAELIPEILRENIHETAGEYLQMGYNTYNDYIVAKVSDSIFSAAVMVGVFLAMVLVFLIIKLIVNAVGRMPVIRCVNRFAGMLAGVLLGFITIAFLFVVLMIFNNTPLAIAVNQDVSDSVFLTFIYKHNLLISTITKIF